MQNSEALRHFFHHSKDVDPLKCDDCREALALMVAPEQADLERRSGVGAQVRRTRDAAIELCDESAELIKDARWVRGLRHEYQREQLTRARMKS